MSGTPGGVPLTGLTAGQLIPFGGDRATEVGPDLAAAFEAGDHLVVVHETGDLLHIPRHEHELAAAAVSSALDAFAALRTPQPEQVSDFYDRFAALLGTRDVADAISTANALDVADARARGRSTGRL